jgi:glycine dehydrogenase subunit 2
MSQLIFQLSRSGHGAKAHMLPTEATAEGIPSHMLRKDKPCLPEVSELEVVRHYTRLSQRNFSIDTQFYPLGSCTMKYNPKACQALARLRQFAFVHPLAMEAAGQGTLACLHELQEMLQEITGMAAISLAPAAGAQGEFAGVAIIRAYHQAQNDAGRIEMLVPDAAHGTNPASATMAGFTVREVPTNAEGDVDLAALQALVGPQTAGIMLTNPSTLGVFERQIGAIADIVHSAGGLLYYDGANLNAILGKTRPGDMGFDVIHLNLHKTFATPHGGGGPGAGPVGVNTRLQPFLPLPVVERVGDRYRLLTEQDRPQSIGRLTAFGGNVGVLVRAYIYARMLGQAGIERVAEFAVLNANYLEAKLKEAGFEPAFPHRRATHEFILTMRELARDRRVTAYDLAKRLLDYGFHAPTVYFPQLIRECLLIEPTETESKQTLDGFVEAMTAILGEAKTDPELLKTAPHTTPVRRLDEVKAARQLNLIYHN